jgi:hypothetical protein
VPVRSTGNRKDFITGPTYPMPQRNSLDHTGLIEYPIMCLFTSRLSIKQHLFTFQRMLLLQNSMRKSCVIGSASGGFVGRFVMVAKSQ